ncbi:MAG: sigma-70 family RNA polymerase sigma factor [Bacteroidales bacterium]|jgi:RNA polymerase sigma-70 factor (ECF subfamily)|nr:sigma-70 family RNA polymerase sigma factor [Bacteroidales bacterium]MDD4217792.1 sigma-70 family RNA polymerase sigma factor [Bacteroidales bacterium]MDY0140515.1 sigma-70 family RNA polymerase sigma factor [Bacteroidales bacterium]
MTDNVHLIKRCQKKSKKAFDELFRTYSSLMYGICLRYTKDQHEAQDLLQECFIRILNKIDTYNFKGSFEGWIKRLTVNHAINYLKTKRHFMSEDISSYEIENQQMNTDVISDMNAQDIVKMINKLPLGYKTIFNLHVVEGYKHTEIAEMLEISDITSRTQFKKAREALIEMIINSNK